MSQAQDSNMASINSPFRPGNPGEMSIGFPDPALINQSLSLALITEQRVHELTRASLREQIDKNSRLQTELDHSNERVRRLQMRMKLMKDTSDDTVDAESGRNAVPDPNDSLEVVGVAVIQTNDESISKCTSKTRKHDQDFLKPVTSSDETPEVKKAVVVANKSCSASEVDERKLFDLDILEGSGLDDTLSPYARQTLRKHFVVDTPKETIANTPIQQSSNKLIEVSPASTTGENRPAEPKVAKLLSVFQVPPANTNSEVESATTMSAYDNIKNLRVSLYSPSFYFQTMTDIICRRARMELPKW